MGLHKETRNRDMYVVLQVLLVGPRWLFETTDLRSCNQRIFKQAYPNFLIGNRM